MSRFDTMASVNVFCVDKIFLAHTEVDPNDADSKPFVKMKIIYEFWGRVVVFIDERLLCFVYE